MALSYITGKLSAKPLNVSLNIPLVLTLSVLPDIDLLIPTLQHGGPAHSIVLYFMMALPMILLWRKKTIPYLIAIVSHPLLGDYLTRSSRMSGVQLFYPLSLKWFSAGSISWQVTYTYAEIALLAAFLLMLVATKDMRLLMTRHRLNMLLLVPISTAFLPVFIQFPIPVPAELIVPHIILMAVLMLSILVDIRHFFWPNSRLS
jgi:hypothetical protein